MVIPADAFYRQWHNGTASIKSLGLPCQPFLRSSRSPGGCTLSSVHSRSLPGETMMPSLSLSPPTRVPPFPPALLSSTLLFLLFGSQSLAKNLIYPLCSARYPVKGEPRYRERFGGGQRARKQTDRIECRRDSERQ